MMKKEFKKQNLQKILISLLLVIAMVVQISFLSYLFKSISNDPNKNKENIIMSYTQESNLDYNVYLKENEFINNENKDSKEAYILDFIDYVRVTSLYKFDSTTKTSVQGTNKLVAKLKVYYRESTDKSNNPEVMTKEKVLDEKVMNFNDSKFSTVSTYDIYLDEYIDIIKNFQNEVKIAVDSYLEVSYVSDFTGKVGGASYLDNNSSTLRIPLSDSVIKIENLKSERKTENVYESDLVKTNKVVMSYIVIANIITFVIICLLLRKLFTFTNKSEYERTINKILRNYDDIIVNTSNMIDVSKYKLIEIDEFKEILNLSRELLLPIMNYKVKEGVTWFYVIKDDILYRHVVAEEKLKVIKDVDKKEDKK